MAEKDKKFIGILSAKGGVGKTTTSINLASALSSFGRNVVVVDGNYTKPNIGVMLGITKVNVTLHHTLRGEEHIKEAVYVHPSGLQVIPGSILYDDLHNKMTRKLEDVLTSIRNQVELAIIDCGPGFSSETSEVLDILDGVLLITTPDLASITDVLKTKKFCEQHGVEVMGVIVSHNRTGEHIIPLSDIEAVLDSPVVGDIPYDESIHISQHKKYPVLQTHPTSASSIAYKKLAANLIGESYDPHADMNESIFDYVLKKIGLK